MIILVLNLGLKSVRCIAFALDGKVLSQSSEPIHTFVSNQRVEQDPHQWIELSWQVITAVISQLGVLSNDVQYITVTTSASCLVAVDSLGQPLLPSILVSDTRSVHEAKLLAHTVEFQQVQSINASKSSPDMMLPKIMWLAKNRPQKFNQVTYFLNVGDYLVAQLTGRYVTDPNNALKFHYIPSQNRYPESLLTSLGIDPTTLPEVLELGTDLGPLLPYVATKIGLPDTCHVILSTYDALAAVTGAGAFEVGDAVDVSGTVTSFRALTDHHLFDPLHRIYVSPYLGKNQWLAGGSNNLGGGIIEWLRQLLFEGLSNPYSLMESYAESQPVCPGGLIFLPHLLGERAPLWNPDCRGVFFGLNRAHNQEQLTRAVFEGVGFSVRHIAEVLKELQVLIKSVTVSGGLSRIEIINQIKADILGVPVRKLNNFETTSIGAALIALIGIGTFNSGEEGFNQFCSIERHYEPDMSKHAIYNEYFQLYIQIYESLRDSYLERSRILEDLQKNGVDELVLTENL
jgi:xylulokinase